MLENVKQYTICALRHPDGTLLDFSPEGMKKLFANTEHFAKKYHREVSSKGMFDIYYRWMPFNNPGFQKLFELLEKEEVLILFHCSAGKDRTGIASMLVRMALGVDRKTALEDYLLTNVYRRQWIEKGLEKNADTIQENPEFKKIVISINGVLQSMGEDALDEIDREYGSFEAYLEDQFQLGTTRLQHLRNMYLE